MTPASAFALVGGRKFVGFLLSLAVVVLFVMTKRVTDQTIIRDLLIGLPSVFGILNVAQKSKLMQPAASTKEAP